MKILVLGHNGMLGNMVLTYLFFKYKDDIITTSLRWDTPEFRRFVLESKVEYIINCIGAIPQRNYNDYSINYDLPLWLDSLGIKIIHPDTDILDETEYSKSKEKAKGECINNTKFIKTSIIGFERNTKYSLLEWFLNLPEGSEINGYINCLWNGNTTLEWVQWADKIMNNWEGFKHITTIANPDCHNKYQLLLLFKFIFEKDVKIIPHESDKSFNNCLDPDYYTKEITTQLIEMKKFYKYPSKKTTTSSVP